MCCWCERGSCCYGTFCHTLAKLFCWCCLPSKDIFDALDEHSSGTISKAEVIQWIADERWMGNRHFLGKSLRTLTERVYEFDVDQDGQLDHNELERFLRTLGEEEQQELVSTLVETKRDVRLEAARKVYDAIDLDNKGVTREEFLLWLETEHYWADFGNVIEDEPRGLSSKARRALADRVDKNHDGVISFEEFAHYFAKFTVRELREMSTDATYMHMYADYKREPSKEKKAKLKKYREEVRYLKRALRREDRRERVHREEVESNARV